MKNLFIILILSPFIFSCSSTDEIVNSKWTFIACEGNYGSSNGSIYMINQFGQLDSITGIGDVVQSVKVKDDKLFVIVNNSHKIIVYNISPDGVALPGIHVSTNGSSPREMVVVKDKLYFTITDRKSDYFNKTYQLYEENIQTKGFLVVSGEDLVILGLLDSEKEKYFGFMGYIKN